MNDELTYDEIYTSIEKKGESKNLNVSKYCKTTDNDIVKGINFSDIIGQEVIKEKLKQILSFIDNPKYYKKLNCEKPKGIMLYGNIGVGKTMLASAFINASKLPYYVLHKNEDEESFIKEIKSVFYDAIKNQPCIILMDDLDKFDEDENDFTVLNIIQSLIDNIRQEDVYIIATCNSIRNILISLRRDGRFDYIYEVKSLDTKDRVKIIRQGLKDINISQNIDFEDINSLTDGYSPISIKSKINKALMIAAYKRRDYLVIEDFIEAILNKNYYEYSWKSKSNLKEIAYHEVGHAIALEVFKRGSVGFVSVISDDYSQGFTLRRDIDPYEKNNDVRKVIAPLGSKACVELNLPLIAKGCDRDIQKAYNIITYRVRENCDFNFNHVQSYSYDNESFTRNSIITMMDYYKIAKNIIIQNRKLVDFMVSMLLEKGYLLYSDIIKLEHRYPIDNSSIIGLV